MTGEKGKEKVQEESYYICAQTPKSLLEVFAEQKFFEQKML